jgi:hypothetical protein
LGGSFGRVSETKDFTGWSYSPVGKTFERLLKQLDFNTYAVAKERITELCDLIEEESGVVIEHVFVDGHPGISMRQYTEITSSDNVVFVASATRGNLTGISQQVALDGPGTRALVLSRVLSMASSDTQQDSVGKEPQEALRSYLSQSKILDAVATDGHRESFTTDSNLEESLQWYLKYYSDSGDRFRTSGGPRKGLWKGHWLSEFPGLVSVIPMEWTRAQHIHDLVFDWRSFAQTAQTGADDLEQNVWGICLLARHLEQSRFTEDRDRHPTKNWIDYYDLALNELGKPQDANLDAAEHFCDEALRLQTEAAAALKLNGQPVHPSWQGDWRVFRLKGRILRTREMTSAAIGELLSIHQQTIASIAQASSVEFRDDVTKARLRSFYESARSDVETEFALDMYARALEKRDRAVAKLACEAISSALNTKAPTLQILECATRLVCDNTFASESRAAGLESVLLQRLSGLQTGRLRRSVLLSQARLQWTEYQRTRYSSRERGRQTLDSIIEKLREWQSLEQQPGSAREADGGLTVSDCAAFLGAIMLESAADSEPGMKRHFFLLAIEQFEQATQNNLEEAVAHIWLALSRLGELSHPEIDILQKEEGRSVYQSTATESGNHGGPTVEQIRQRDAFYAIEQSYAIYRNPQNPDFYFTGEAAAYLADNLTLTLQVLEDEWMSRQSPLLHRLGISCPDFKKILAAISGPMAEAGPISATVAKARISELMRDPS